MNIVVGNNLVCCLYISFIHNIGYGKINTFGKIDIVGKINEMFARSGLR